MRTMIRQSVAFTLSALLGTSLAAPTLFIAAPGLAAEQAVSAPAASDSSAARDAARAQAKQLIQSGLNYLKQQQQADGAFAPKQAPPAITAIALRAFVQSDDYKLQDPFIQKAFELLLTYQGKNGSIANDMQENYNTAIAVSALAAAGDTYKSQMDHAVEFLRSIQWTDKIQGQKNLVDPAKPSEAAYGGWGYGKHSRPDMSNLQMTLNALHDAGLKPGDPAYQAAIVFITRSQNRSESNDQPWAGNDGGFTYTPANNGESPAGVFVDPTGARRLRSYGSMTYAGLKSMIYAGLSKDDPRVKAAWSWIENNWSLNENPGMGAADTANAQFGLYYYYMTMGRALQAYGQPVITDSKGNKHDWRVELIRTLGELQKPDGSWSGDKRWMEDNPTLVTCYAVLAAQNALQDLNASK